MKTAAEAIDTVIHEGKTQEDFESSTTALADIGGRYKSIMEEVMHNPKVMFLTAPLAAQFGCCEEHRQQAMLTCFCNGVLIGIEMEKQEAECPSADEEPTA